MKEKIWNYIIIAVIILVISIFVFPFYANEYLAGEETYTGEFIQANKVYMPDNNIKLVLYFNSTVDNTKFIVFDGWEAKHSILLSNMVEGTEVKIHYRTNIFWGEQIIIRIEML